MAKFAVRHLVFYILIFALWGHADSSVLTKRFVPGAQTASIDGNWALWHNPAGLAFMNGGESSMRYLYEWSERGNRHHGGINLAVNVWDYVTFAGGIESLAAFQDKAKAELGTELSGIVAVASKLSDYASFGVSFLKTYNFLARERKRTLVTFGLQLRPFSFLSLGGHYEEVHGGYFAAPNLTAGFSARPYKEYFTIGVDGKWLPKGQNFGEGFHFHPLVSIKGSYKGYGATVGAEFPGMPSGLTKPIFSFLLDFNFTHLGMSVAGAVNTAENNFAAGGSLRTSSAEWTSISPRRGLGVEITVDHEGRLEQKPLSLAERIFSMPENALSVLGMLKRIEKDPSISHVRIKLSGFSFGDARTQEWRNAILALRQANKEVEVYLDAPSERDYYIATAANRIQMNQYTSLSFHHFQTTLVYFADLLEKVGVKAEAVAAGSYKSAPRQWTNSRPSKQEIEIANNILNSFYETLITEIKTARNIDAALLTALMDKGEISAVDAQNAGLVDELVSPSGYQVPLQDEAKVQPVAQRFYFTKYEDRQFKREGWHPPKKIVVIPVVDAITEGRAIPGLFSWLFPISGAKDIIDEIEDAASDPNVIGIIIRIDSPGGDALAGHRINHALMEAQKSKPVITSMSDVAASAGYLIAAGTNHILAMPNTITGSIGVYSLMFSGEQLAQKIGVFSKELSPIKNPGPTIFRGMSKEERQEMERITEWFYQNFLESVSVGLDLDVKEVRKIADGRVWLGKEAFDRKLVHEIGGFSEALDSVRALAKTPAEVDVTVEIRTPGQNQQFSLTANIAALFHAKSKEDKEAIKLLASPYMQALQAYRINAVPQARLPFDVVWPHRQNAMR